MGAIEMVARSDLRLVAHSRRAIGVASLAIPFLVQSGRFGWPSRGVYALSA